ncbi:MAG: hypothetical protein V2I54_11990 [Bacteroidales bacterium]|jgi:hypothetical protein|nr:hypothetical protein [Bacteroidales bacterium]
MKKILVIILLFTGKICAGQNSIVEQLEADSLIHRYFNHSEILSIATLIETYDAWILSETLQKDLNQAYHEFFERVNHCYSAKELLSALSLPGKQIDSVFSVFDRNHSVRAFWELAIARESYQTDTIILVLDHYHPGSYYKYMQYLEELSLDYPHVGNYVASIRTTGTLSPSLVAGTAKNHHRFDFNEIRWRMFYAIHHLTISFRAVYSRID